MSSKPVDFNRLLTDMTQALLTAPQVTFLDEDRAIVTKDLGEYYDAEPWELTDEVGPLDE